LYEFPIKQLNTETTQLLSVQLLASFKASNQLWYRSSKKYK